MQHTIRIAHVTRSRELLAEARLLLQQAGVVDLTLESLPVAPPPNLDAFLGAAITGVGVVEAALVRQNVPIAIGDAVTIENRNGRHDQTARGTIAQVGRSLVHVFVGGRSKAFSLQTGREHRLGIERLNDDDVARIRRDLAPKR